MQRKLYRELVVACMVFAACASSCMKPAQPQAGPGGFPPKMDVAASLEMAVREIRKQHNLNRPYELTAKVGKNGEWVFTFSFLPKTPGAEIIAVVGTNGVQVMPGI